MPKRPALPHPPDPQHTETDAVAALLSPATWPGFAAHHSAVQSIALRSGIKRWSSGLRIAVAAGAWAAAPTRQWWSDAGHGMRTAIEPSEAATGHESMALAALAELSAAPLARIARLLPAAIAAELEFAICIESEGERSRSARTPARRKDRVLLTLGNRVYVLGSAQDPTDIRDGMRASVQACAALAAMEEPGHPRSAWDIDAVFPVHGEENGAQIRVRAASLDQAISIALIRTAFQWGLPFDRIRIHAAVRHEEVGIDLIDRARTAALRALHQTRAIR